MQPHLLNIFLIHLHLNFFVCGCEGPWWWYMWDISIDFLQTYRNGCSHGGIIIVVIIGTTITNSNVGMGMWESPTLCYHKHM